MQFIRQVVPKHKALITRAISTATKEARPPKLPRYTPQNQQILDETMIPGPYLRFFKTKREKKRHEDGTLISPDTGALDLYTSPARPINFNEFDSAPTIAQERLSERLNRAISTMYTMETLPTKWVTLDHLTIRGVKVSRNLRKCRILYEPTSTVKRERGNVHRALQDYTPLLNTLIRTHALLKRPLSIKFIPDTQAKELDDIFHRLEAEEKDSLLLQEEKSE
ncbi:hypothetical protein HPULCUR_000429 [Helicostylum pulchrum]|uniref:Ribosomal protein S10 n=1 Tax=Helicostylum pulchrum TaxID=562976 RepID=A0ABP9XL01_9FUNG